MDVENVVLCDLVPCGSYKNRRFGGMCRLNLEGENNERTTNTLAVIINLACCEELQYEKGSKGVKYTL
jgi:hypothetical protein